MDIRSYFSPKSSSRRESKSSSRRESKSSPTREDRKSSSSSSQKRKRAHRIQSSDSENESSSVETPRKKTHDKSTSSKTTTALKPVDADEFFGSRKAQKLNNTKEFKEDLKAVVEDMSERDFVLDDDEDFRKGKSKKIKLEKEKEGNPSSEGDKSLSKKLSNKISGNKKRSYKIEVEEVPTKIKKTPQKSQVTDDDEIPPTPQEDYEEMKKKHSAQYKQFLARGGARNPGCKKVPEITPESFNGLVFVLTGVYESLEREEMSEIVKKCGGKVTTSLSKNTNYLVVGEQPGESKLKKADTLGTKVLNEDQFLDLLRKKSDALNKDLKQKSKKSDKSQKKLESDKVRSDSHKKEKESSRIEKTKKKPTPEKKPKNNDTPKKPKTDDAPKKLCYENIGRDRIEKGAVEEEPKPSGSQSCVSSSVNTQLWVDKYKPLNLKNIIGQQGDRSNMKKLFEWLKNWSMYHGRGPNKVKPPPRPSPWATSGDNGGWAKCALLSGPPGVGKTTTATLVSKELGFDVMEMNASDSRSKKSLELNVKEALSSRSLSKTSTRRVILMDEVDGMAGNEDRGGIAQLIQLFKESKIPIICMCNDRNHEKIRSLANHCFDLRFQRPRLEQIKASMMSICFKEKLKVSPEALNELIMGCNQDVRQVLHQLSMIKAREGSSQSLTREEGKKEASLSKKTSIKMGPWDVCKKVFSSQEHQSMSLFDKSDLFFYDYSIGPLFVQENYLSVTPDAAKKDRKKTMELISLASDSLCNGDLVEKTIRSRSAWGLLPVNAIYSSVIPGEYMSGFLHGQIQFPSWLGKNSRRSKMHRILQELTLHSRLRTGASLDSISRDYSQFIRNAITTPLVCNGSDGVSQSIEVMEAYSLQREDLDSLLEYSSWPDKSDPMKSVESKVKSAFTRTYNKEMTTLPYSIVQSNVKKKASVVEDSLYNEENAEDIEEEDEDDIKKDAMIKAKSSKSSSKTQDKKGNSKSKKGSSKGKGK